MIKVRKSRALLTALGCCMLLPASASAAETLTLDSYSSTATGATPPVVGTAGPMPAGQTFLIVIRGTVSVWGAGQWAKPGPCGLAEDRPRIDSAGPNNTPTGIDAQTVFATPADASFGLRFNCTTTGLPIALSKLDTPERENGGIRADTGVTPGTFARLVPDGGSVDVPNVDHTYSYTVAGQNKPFFFRFDDDVYTDNDGAFQVLVTTPAECAATNCTAPQANDPAPGSPGSTTPGSTTPGSTATPATPKVLSNAALGLPSAKRCIKNRTFTLKLKEPRGVRIKTTTLKVNGKKVTVRRRSGRLTAKITLKKGTRRAKVDVLVVTTRGQTLRGQRTYKSCSSADLKKRRATL